MNRRNFLKLSAVAVVAALVPSVIPQGESRRIYVVDHGGENTWWAATSEEEVRRLHHEEFGGYENPNDLDVFEMDDDETLDVDTGDGVVMKTCGEWARESLSYKVPLIATSCF